MRLILSGLCICLFSITAMAQVNNDECLDAIDLGIVPFCNDQVHTNVGSTTSNVDNIPDCWVGNSTDKDVWFTFSTTDVIGNLILTLEGVSDGSNNKSIQNPQLAVYRGNCEGLALLSCQSTEAGQSGIKFSLPELTTNTTYFVQVNNYETDQNEDNSGDFSICIEEAPPVINIGEVASSDACSGRLFDSGGPGANYRPNEDFSFVICPSEPHECIQLDIESFNIDPSDQLRFYAGDNVSAPLLAVVSGNDIGTGYRVLAPSECVTVRFTSDNLLSFEGFALEWSCSASPCDASTIDEPTIVNNLPFSASGLSTCDGGATFIESPCSDADYLNGPEYVFAYDAPGNTCTSISISGAESGTGLLVLNGLPGDPNTSCVAAIQSNSLSNVDMRAGGTYYIVVANEFGCTNFDINIETVECMLSPALRSALCNPLNDCLASQDEVFNIQLEDGFKDFTIQTDINGGCWLNDGEEPDYFWFTIQAAADGDFGFIMESGGTPSDIDFNVWGPFSTDQVCEDADQIINFIQTNQPIRSSWNSVDLPTGMARVHPFNGNPIDDTYDCGSTPSGQGDQFVLPVEMNEGEIYVVLLNDWGNQVGPEGINVDWSPTDPGVLNAIPTVSIPTDTAICAGESAQLLLENYSNEVRWFGNTAGLSCLDCPDPIATPSETTVYTAAVEKACNVDTVEVRVAILEVDAGPNIQVCIGEDFQIVAGEDYPNAQYEWEVTNTAFDNLVSFSCTNCPDPIITAENVAIPNASTEITIRVSLITGNCTLTDEMDLIIDPQNAAAFTVSNDADLCLGNSVNIGDNSNSNLQTYSWTSRPTGFVSQNSNPEVSPTETTTYFVSVDNGSCPSPSIDSVTVNVFTNPTVSLLFTDTTICEGDVLIMADLELEEGVSYQWSGGQGITNEENPNTTIRPTSSANYSLTATRGACVITESVNVTVIPVQANIDQGSLLRVCKGEEDTISVSVQPLGAIPNWTASDGSIDGTMTDTVGIFPNAPTTYYVTVENEGCSILDSIEVVIDSLPLNLMIEPQDTTVCEGGIVVLKSPVFEPFEFPNITHMWGATGDGRGPSFQSPDSLYNMVITPDTTLTYFRITENGACRDSLTATIFVDTIPDITIVPENPEICFGESVDVQVTTEAQLEEIMWMPMEGLSCTDCLTPTITPISQGSNTYTMQAMAGECSVSASITIEVRAPFALPAQAQICEGESIQLNSIVDPNLTYTWTSTDPDFGTVTDPSPIVSPTENTTYFLTVNDPVCGEIQAELLVEVDEIPMYQFTDIVTICSGEEVQLNTVVTDGATYSWSNTDPSVPSSTDPLLRVSPSQTSTYSLVITNGVCPAVRDELTLTVIPSPEVPDSREICQGESIGLNNKALNDDFGYSWSSSTDPGFSSTDPNPVVAPTETTTYTLTATNSSCGEVSGEFTITVIPTDVQISVTASQTQITQGDQLTLSGEITGDDSGTLLWSASNPLNQPTDNSSLSVTFSPQELDTTVYRLTYFLPNDCGSVSDEVTVIISPRPQFRVPNAFTPNNDLDNDFFNIVVPEGLEQSIPDLIDEFKVYNRWGQLIYDNDNPDQGWDGTHNGTPAPSDVYVFYVVVRIGENGQTELRKGDVTLIR